MDYLDVLTENLPVKENTVGRIHPVSQERLGVLRDADDFLRSLPQLDVQIQHVLHGGMYARTCMLPAGAILSGVLLSVPTVLIVQGDAIMEVDGQAHAIRGYNVFAASAGRKQAMIAVSDVWMTALRPTSATTVEQAESEATNEPELLTSRQLGVVDNVLITGE